MGGLPLPPIPLTVKSSFCSGVLSVNCVDRELKRLFGNRKANRFLELSAALKSPFSPTKVYESHQNCVPSNRSYLENRFLILSLENWEKLTLFWCVIVVLMKHHVP